MMKCSEGRRKEWAGVRNTVYYHREAFVRPQGLSQLCHHSSYTASRKDLLVETEEIPCCLLPSLMLFHYPPHTSDNRSLMAMGSDINIHGHGNVTWKEENNR